jgi:hypothetical protein
MTGRKDTKQGGDAGRFQRFRGNVAAIRSAGNDVSAETPPL